MKVLIINLTRMGDILQSSPLVWGLKQKYSDCKVHYLADRSFAAILSNMKGIDKIINFDIREVLKRVVSNRDNLVDNFNYFSQIAEDLQKEEYDLVINLTHTDESKALTYVAQGKKVAGITMDKRGYRIIKHPWENYFYTSNLNQGLNRINLVDIYLRLGDVLETPRKLFFTPSETATIKCDQLFSLYDLKKKEYYCIQLGASVDNKRYRAEDFAETANILYEKHGLIPVFVGTEKELPLYEQAAHFLKYEQVNLMGKTSIDTLGEILSRSNFLLTNDTGTMHIASGVGIPIICIALATAYSHETASYAEGNIVIEAEIPCTPCSHHVQCQNPICKSYIKPVHLVQFIENLKEIRSGLSFEDNQEMNTIKAYLTKFDEYGYLRLFPLIKREITSLDIVNLVIHHLWVNTLGFEDYTVNETYDFDKYYNSIIKEIEKWYLPMINSSVQKEIISLVIKMEELILLGKDGLTMIEKMINLYYSKKYNQLADIGENLIQIDEKISDKGMLDKRLRPITFLFQFGKNNLDSNNISLLFDKTAILYRQIIFRSDFTIRLLKMINRQLESSKL